MNHDEYLKLAEVEDRMWYFRSLHGHVARELAASPLPACPEVLDAGCGTGGLVLRAREFMPEARWSGIDFMPLACELARRRCGPDVNIREASITGLPHADGAFDVVASVDVICQVPDPENAIAEFHRVLRPGGVLLLNVPAYQWMWSYHDDAAHTKHRYTRPEIAALLRDGFAVRRLTHWNALPFPAVWARRKLFSRAGDTSDVKDYGPLLEAGFRGLMGLEHAWLRAGGNWAWGTSILAVATRR